MGIFCDWCLLSHWNMVLNYWLLTKTMKSCNVYTYPAEERYSHAFLKGISAKWTQIVSAGNKGGLRSWAIGQYLRAQSTKKLNPRNSFGCIHISADMFVVLEISTPKDFFQFLLTWSFRNRFLIMLSIYSIHSTMSKMWHKVSF